VFASTAINAFEGSLGQLGKQAIAAGVTLAFSFVATLAILKVVDRLLRLRATEEEEEAGLDLTQHAESAYTPDAAGTSKALTHDDIERMVTELIRATHASDATSVVTEGTTTSGAAPG
jgi:hypothetical protein